MADLYTRVRGTNDWLVYDPNRAPLYAGVARGRPVARCQRCQKVAFSSEYMAAQRAIEIGFKAAQRPYLGGACGWWHLTSKNGAKWLHDRVGDKVSFVLRDYQEESVTRIFEYFSKHDGNPVIALPTGTGKSLVIAEFIRRACTWYEGTQILVLTHVKELIEQNSATAIRLWPTAPLGVYSAGLGRREYKHDITFAGIQSVHSKADLFGHIDLVLIDECHLVSPKSETMYGRFIASLRRKNPKLKVVGFSATPFRMKQGMLTDPGGLFTDVAHDLTSREAFNKLMTDGWICNLVPRHTSAELDVTGVKITAGEFNQKALQEKVDQESVTIAALNEAVRLAEVRKHWLVFASGVEHAEHIAEYLDTRFGISARAVHSKMPDEERDAIIASFKQGEIQAVVNYGILTTGFDYPNIDCIVMLRPTASPGLWVQMLGRGTRPVYAEGFDLTTAEGRRNAISAGPKPNCLVLDFAGNTRRLGPINDPVLPRRKGKKAAGVAPVRLCEHCHCYSHASARFCENPVCGEEFPKSIRFGAIASIDEIVAGVVPDIHTIPVDRVLYLLHKKEGKPDSMRVMYYSGLRVFSEYICLDHGGYAGLTARKWWSQRCPWGVPPSVADGMKAINYLKVPTHVDVVMQGKYPQICGYTFASSS